MEQETTFPFGKLIEQHLQQKCVLAADAAESSTNSSSCSNSAMKGLTVITGNSNASSSSSLYNSPSLISPPSSAFVSALQSPYISPRATANTATITTGASGGGVVGNVTATVATQNPNQNTTLSSSSQLVSSYCASDVPSSSYTPPIDSTSFTPPPESYDFSDDPRLKYMTYNIPYQDPPPRTSFSFPVQRTSFTKNSISPPANAKLRSCDVYIGFHGQNPNLIRFCKWVKTELEIQGIACFVADRAKYSDNQNHEIADRVISSVTHGVVVITPSTLFNHLTMEEIRFFTQKKNIIPVFFGTDMDEVMSLLNHNRGGVSADHSKLCKEAIDGLMKHTVSEFKVEANEGNWRACVTKIAGTLRNKLGRRSVVEKEVVGLLEELPFPRNRFFVGREKEIAEIETMFFGYEQDCNVPNTRGGGAVSGQSEGLADEESDAASTTRGGRYISLELGRCKSKEPTLEAWIEQPAVTGRNSYSKKSKYKKSSKSVNGNNVICINGVSGIGKTELALEYAYRYSQRYKMVLWVGGETRYFRQNILNISINLGLDVSADAEKERGRIRSFEEQEVEAFKRVKRELFRDMPYLLIIDNLESEIDWWEGKDLHDLIPRNTGGGTHVIITTRLLKVMNFDTTQLPQLSLSDAMILIRGRRKKDYPSDEVECLRKFDEKLGRLTYGLWVIGSLLSELAISPSALFEAINQVPLDEVPICDYVSSSDDQICRNNQFLMKALGFCMLVLEQKSRRKNFLALRMFLVGAWFAPAPISSNLLAISAKNLPNARDSRFKKWSECMSLALLCCHGSCLSHQSRKSEEDAALFLIRMGLARRSSNKQPGCWIVLHPIAQLFAKRKGGLASANATVLGVVKKSGNPLLIHSDHLWATAFMVFGFKSEPPLVQLKANDIVLFINRTALPLAIKAFTTFSRCNSALELLAVCTSVLEEVEKSFVSQIQDWCQGSLCWKKLQSSNQKVDEYLWQDVTLLKATLLETRAKLLLRGGHFDKGEELCRTCISIRTVMLGHNHNQTLAAQETLAKLVKMRSKISISKDTMNRSFN